jgi:hypothetical protein
MEGQQTESGDAPPSKVVRLPRDWLGPHEALVPLGGPPRDDEVEGTPGDATEPPPGPADFWGERSAAIHDALQTPVRSHAPEDGPGRRSVVLSAWNRISLPRIGCRGRPRTWIAAMTVAGAALGAGIAIAMLSAASGPRPVREPRLNMAVVLGASVSKLLDVRPPTIVPRTTTPRHRVRPVRHVAHRAPKPPPPVTRHESASPPARVDAAPAALTAVSPNTSSSHSSIARMPSTPIETSAPSARPSVSSRTRVNPTGQTGALGPVSSPNG